MLNKWKFDEITFDKEWYENEERGRFRVISGFYLGETGNLRIRPLKKGILAVKFERINPQIIRHK